MRFEMCFPKEYLCFEAEEECENGFRSYSPKRLTETLQLSSMQMVPSKYVTEIGNGN
jgi:hypothetical protein